METCRMVKEKEGVKAFAYTCDCSNRQEIYRVADQVKKEVGDVTILINNAGVVTGKLFLNTPDDMVERSFLVNALSHVWTYKAFLPAMMKANHGHLVCISSTAGIVGINGLSDYCASKFAAFGFAESLYIELRVLKKSNIKTTIVCPYFIKTGMFDGCTTKYPFLLPILEKEYVAEKVLNAILEEQTYLMMPKFVYFALLLKQILSSNMIFALIEYLGLDTCMASFIGQSKAGVRQNMAPSVNTAKELSIFLVKAMFAFLEAAIFALIPKPLKNVAGEIVLITVLVLWDINEEGNEETRRMAWDAGAMTVHAYTCDCGRKEEVYRVANQGGLRSPLFSRPPQPITYLPKAKPRTVVTCGPALQSGGCTPLHAVSSSQGDPGNSGHSLLTFSEYTENTLSGNRQP
ncbi:short-chain dehydrogenase/reductase family 16C member 6 [Camelus ferus]|nr:short-chain dehydrogenase/reductase family 16C member 6 [Camelus ferus]